VNVSASTAACGGSPRLPPWCWRVSPLITWPGYPNRARFGRNVRRDCLRGAPSDPLDVGAAERLPLIGERISDFADLVATAIANAATRADLIASRARIVTDGNKQRPCSNTSTRRSFVTISSKSSSTTAGPSSDCETPPTATSRDFQRLARRQSPKKLHQRCRYCARKLDRLAVADVWRSSPAEEHGLRGRNWTTATPTSGSGRREVYGLSGNVHRETAHASRKAGAGEPLARFEAAGT
jgi:hypothetical protein